MLCDDELHSMAMEKNNDHSRFLLRQNCVPQAAAKKRLHFCHGSENNFGSSDLGIDSSCVDRHWGFPFVSAPPYNGDSSISLSSFGNFQNFDNYTKNDTCYEQVPMLHPECFYSPKDSSYSGFDIYQTKEDNVWVNNFDFSGEDLIITDEMPGLIADNTAEMLSSGMSSALANANSYHQDHYNKNQMIGSSKANEETNNIGIFSNKAIVHLDYAPSQLILSNEMLPRENQTLASKLQTRQEALKRYFAKKKIRKFGKQIRYESRKSTADTKRRMKGRFTRAGAEYDFDPRSLYNKESHKII